jgi:hypothetical protein
MDLNITVLMIICRKKNPPGGGGRKRKYRPQDFQELSFFLLENQNRHHLPEHPPTQCLLTSHPLTYTVFNKQANSSSHI